MADKVTNKLQIEVPKSFVDEGNGIVSFPEGLTITDGTVQRNGTTYDMDTLDISRYGNQLTGDHVDELGNLIGETLGVIKANGKVVVNKIRYAVKENPYAKLAYDLLVGGFSKNFSTETIGPSPDPNTGVYYNAELVGLSQVVTQNNYNAHINKVVHNSLEQSKANGLDVDHNKDIQKFVNDFEAAKAKEEEKMEDENKKVETPVAEVTPETKVEEVKTETPVEAKVDTPVEEAKETPAPAEEVAENKATKEAKTEVEKAENGTWVETTTTTTTREYVESEEEIAERKAREAKWDAQDAARLEAEKAPDTVVVIVDSENEATDKTENKTEKTETAKNEVDDTTEAVVEEEQKETKEEKEMEDKTSNAVTPEQIAEIVANALKPLSEELATVKAEAKNAFDASAKEPEFKKDENAVAEEAKASNDYASMDWETRYNKQVAAAWNAVKLNSIEGWEELRAINKVNFEALKEKGIAKNAITLDDLGNFVIPPEMYNEIVGHRNDYTSILNETEWRETLSLEFTWLKRVGDIDMRNVAIGWDNGTGVDGADNDRLKPISEYSAIPQKSELEELAAVTVVATSTTRFGAVDLLADAAKGYRTDYDRKRAQLVIASLEDAVDETGFSVPYAPSDDVDALTTWLEAVTAISDTTLNGTLVFNARTFAELKSRALKAGANGPLSEILTTGDIPTVFGYRFVIVPNDLMPSLGGSEVISHTVHGVSKRINHAVFFADLTAFTGRTSGGLMYDVSNSASYEVEGSTRSAYQRNELVLRGSFFRGGAVRDVSVIAGVRQGNASNVS